MRALTVVTLQSVTGIIGYHQGHDRVITMAPRTPEGSAKAFLVRWVAALVDERAALPLLLESSVPKSAGTEKDQGGS